MIHANGCIPNSLTPESVAMVDHYATEWDAADQPQISDWASFEAWLKGRPDLRKNWWEGIDVSSLFTASQEYRPNCAGFAMANAALCSTLLQIKNRFSEQDAKRFNPMVTWQKSKGGSVYGGQSISAIALAGCEYGNYLAEDVGSYDPDVTFPRTQADEDEHARAHQIGFALYDGTRPWDAIMLACRKGYACFVGNSRAVGGSSRDVNGVPVANISGSWSHATAFAGYQYIGGLQYVFWINSHGDIYESDGQTPRFGCWMSESILKTFMSSSFNDLAVVTYAEAPYNLELKPTLTPEAACA